MKLRFNNLVGWLKFKPFAEDDDDARIAGVVYSRSAALSALIILNGLLTLGSLILAVTGNPVVAIKVFLVVAAISAVVGGLEWNAGLKAKALNRLFITLIMLVNLMVLAYAVSVKST